MEVMPVSCGPKGSCGAGLMAFNHLQRQNIYTDTVKWTVGREQETVTAGASDVPLDSFLGGLP